MENNSSLLSAAQAVIAGKARLGRVDVETIPCPHHRAAVDRFRSQTDYPLVSFRREVDHAKGVGTAVIDGGGGDAITITGSSRVSLMDFEVTNGANGITARDGSHIALSGVNSHDNSGAGIVLQTASTAILSGVSVHNNGGIGLSGDDGVSMTLRSSTLTGNTIKDIQFTFAARADIQASVFGTYSCDATVLVRGTSGITCPH